MDPQTEHSQETNSTELVAQVNMVDEAEPDDAGDWPEPVPGGTSPAAAAESAPPPRAPILQVIPLGLIALAVIAISMFVILSGVFEMIPN